MLIQSLEYLLSERTEEKINKLSDVIALLHPKTIDHQHLKNIELTKKPRNVRSLRPVIRNILEEDITLKPQAVIEIIKERLGNGESCYDYEFLEHEGAFQHFKEGKKVLVKSVKKYIKPIKDELIKKNKN